MSQQSAKNVLIERSVQIAAAADLAAQSTNDWQMIQAAMTGRLNDLPLTPRQEEKLKRYQYIYNQLVTGKYTEEEVRESIQKIYELSYVQARNDIRDAKEVFASSVNINKLFEVKVQLELNRKYTNMAIAKGDLRAAAQFEKNRDKLLEKLPEQEDTAAENFEPHNNIFTFDPALLGLEPMQAGDISQLLRDIKSQTGIAVDLGFKYGEEIDYEEVSDGE